MVFADAIYFFGGDFNFLEPVYALKVWEIWGDIGEVGDVFWNWVGQGFQ